MTKSPAEKQLSPAMQLFRSLRPQLHEIAVLIDTAERTDDLQTRQYLMDKAGRLLQELPLDGVLDAE